MLKIFDKYVVYALGNRANIEGNTIFMSKIWLYKLAGIV